MPKDGGSFGTWLVSDALGAPQTFSCAGRTWLITLRPARYYKPYSVTLQKFTHERYAGTEIPKNFSSRVTLIDPERSVNRDVLIYMNHPLRYRGETFYQAGFEKDDSDDDFASRAQPELHRALCRVHDRCCRAACAIRLSSRRLFAATKERTGMKRFFPAIVFGFALLWIAASLLPPKSASDDVRSCQVRKDSGPGRRPRQAARHGRAQLAAHHSRQTDGAAGEWKTDRRDAMAHRCSFNAPVADEYPVFVIQNAEVLGLFGWEQSDRKYFSFAELSPFLKQIDEQGDQSDKLQSVQRSAYQNAILNLRNALVLYQRLKNSVQPEGAQNFAGELESFETSVPGAGKAARQRENRTKTSTKRNSMTWRS